MSIPGNFRDYYPLLLLAGVVIILCIFRVRHKLQDIRRKRRGLCQFFTCHGKERWGPPAKIKEWQRTSIRHLIARRESLDNDIWQMKNKRNNLAEMQSEELKKYSELEREKTTTYSDEDNEKFLFIEFEIFRNKVKTEYLRNHISQKDRTLQSMEDARQRINECLKSYTKGDNPRLNRLNSIKGLFFDLR
jgi:hypothetical protein